MGGASSRHHGAISYVSVSSKKQDLERQIKELDNIFIHPIQFLIGSFFPHQYLPIL
jgi:predicted site-specific integrase-resolvase